MRISWIDFGKGFTILSVLLVHVMLGVVNSGVPYTAQQLWVPTIVIGFLFTYVMPVFFAMSGYVYKPVKTWQQFFKKSGQRLISLGVPYIAFNVVIYIVKLFGNDKLTLLDLLNIWNQPIAYTWYLFALFGIYVLVDLYHLVGLPLWSQIILGVVTLILVSFDTIHIGLLSQAFRWVLPFILGIAIKEYAILNRKYLTVLATGIFIISSVIAIRQYFMMIEAVNVLDISLLAVKLSSVFVFLALYRLIGTEQNRWLTFIGKNSLIVYLVHVPVGTLVMKIIEWRVPGLTVSYWAFMVATLVVTLVFSLVAVLIANRFRVVNVVFQPIKVIASLRESR
ncbi:acyltransferase family protein [Weissella confusa]|uniref:acyltransferase family protein n=1 Tax=Weissella confusa TaxID=1583 RepID=UPI001300860A|nr:acyltransferase [Weissella confusa]